MDEPGNIDFGQYVVFQKKDFTKLHLVSEKNNSVFIGKDKIELQEIIGKKFGSVFQIVPIKGSNRSFSLKNCSLNYIYSSKKLIENTGSGIDNRSINDDGTSQVLTSDSIEELRDNGTAPNSIIKQLVENSKTFQKKTEYSQQKYIKKKQCKYFEFITVYKPTIRLLAKLFYSRDITKVIGLRIDTLSQITTAVNFQSDCNYLLVENGFNGIVSAMLLSQLSSNGRIVNVTPGSQNQRQAVLAMNFSKSHSSQMLTIRLSTLNNLKKKNVASAVETCDVISPLESSDANCNIMLPNETCEDLSTDFSSSRKRKFDSSQSNSLETEQKKPRWEIEAELALEVLSKKVDGLVIVCKEFPGNILTDMLTYLSPSRPFVIYSLYQEPLVSIYLSLKKRHDIIYLKITETWYRPYQVLENRTHPSVTVNSSSGYLLSGLKVF